jgi:hypothetical protein
MVSRQHMLRVHVLLPNITCIKTDKKKGPTEWVSATAGMEMHICRYRRKCESNLNIKR